MDGTHSSEWWSEPKASFKISCDVLIIGSGPAGSMVAMTLAEAGLHVVLIEKGRAMTQNRMPKTIRSAVRDWYAESGFRTTKGNTPIPVAGGEGMGGGTLVNSALCFKTPRTSLEHWNELSNGAFADTAQYYVTQQEVLNLMQVATTPEWLLSGNDKAHKLGAQKLGWQEGNIPRNTPGCVGCSRCNLGCPSGGKYSTDKEMLPRAAKAGAEIMLGCMATEIKETRGMVYVSGKILDGRAVIDDFEIQANTLILSAGAIATPSILLDSRLDKDNPDIGQGLHLQPVANIFGLMPNPVESRGAAQGHYVDAFVEDNILLESNPILAGAFFQTFPIYGADAQSLMKSANRFISTGSLVRDTSEGRVSKSSSGAAQIHYDLNDLDRQRLIQGLRYGAEIWLDGAGAERIVPALFGTHWCSTLAEAHTLLSPDLDVGRLSVYSSHPQASCRIGRACDSEGKLHGTNNIYVMDGSALPSNVGRNPQISILTVTRLLAERLLQSKGQSAQPLLSTQS